MTKFFISTLAAILFSSCTLYHNTEVIDKDATRTKVKFESKEALSKFQYTLKHTSSNTGEGTKVGFILYYRKSVIYSDNAKFNKLINECDVNGDLIISNDEADVFANNKLKKNEKLKYSSESNSLK